MFNHNFWTSVPIFIIFFLGRILFSRWSCQYFRYPTFSLSVRLTMFLGHKWRKIWSNVMNLENVFQINKLRSYTKNCHRMLDTFYRVISKSFLYLSSAITFKWMIQFPYYFFWNCWCRKGFIFMRRNNC